MRKTTIDIKTLFQVFKKNWAIIIASAIILMMGAVIYANTLVTPMFTSQIDVMIDNRLSNEVNPTVGEVTSSQQLTATYMTVMENVGQDYVIKQYKEALCSRVEQLGNEQGISVENVDVLLEEDENSSEYGRILYLKMKAKGAGPEFIKMLAAELGMPEENINPGAYYE